MEPIVFRYRGRDLTASDNALIRATIAANYGRGRSFIAQVLCEHWDWRQPNGAYKGFGLLQRAKSRFVHVDHHGCHNRPKRYLSDSYHIEKIDAANSEKYYV